MYTTIVGELKDVRGRCFRILALDGLADRLRNLRITGNDYTLSLVSSYTELLRALNDESHFDLVIASALYSSANSQMIDIVAPLAVAHGAKKVGGVIITTPCDMDGRAQVKELRAAGVPCCYYPLNWNNPANHVESLV